MREIMKMTVSRLKKLIIVYIIIISVFSLAAAFFSKNVSVKANIAVVNGEELIVESDQIKITKLEEEPNNSELALAKYDAVVIFKEDGFEIKTTKGEQIKEIIENIIEGKEVENKEEQSTRGAISNILGFSTMAILLVGLDLYFFYVEERNGINKRIIGANISYAKYLMSYFIVIFFALFIPASIVVLSSVAIFQLQTIVSTIQIIFILSVLCFLSSSFGLFLNVILKNSNSAIMIGEMIIILSTIISGSFAPVTDNKLFITISQVLPQRQIMDYIVNLENGVANNLIGMTYIFIISVIFIITAIYAEKKLMPNR